MAGIKENLDGGLAAALDPILDAALAEGGLTSIELTMTTPGAIEMCAKVSRELPDVLLGLGTVLDADTCKRGIAAGAKFIVTPAVRPDVIKACNAAGLPVLSGALTPTEASITTMITPMGTRSPRIVNAHVSPGLRTKTRPQIAQRSIWDHPENSGPSPQCGQRLRNPR